MNSTPLRSNGAPRRGARRPISPIALAGVVVLTALGVVACASVGERDGSAPPPMARLGGDAYAAAARIELPEVQPEEQPGLHNVFHLSQHIVSGSEPQGEAAFQKLEDLGISTILSVDGNLPDAELAKQHGMRYVHVPIQYSGITDDEMLRIAKTFREQPGPFYVHCFHGKHRGPAAAAIGRLVLDGASRQQAIAEMRQWCGTAPSYEGLYRAVAENPIPSAEQTAAYAFDFPAAHTFTGFRQGMIEVSRADDNIQYLSKHGWQPGADHPDVDARNEATKLAAALAHAQQLDEVAVKPADFRRWLAAAVQESADLRDAVAAWHEHRGPTADLDQGYRRLAATCTACHDVYRN